MAMNILLFRPVWIFKWRVPKVWGHSQCRRPVGFDWQVNSSCNPTNEGMSPWRPLTELLYYSPINQSRYRNWFEELKSHIWNLRNYESYYIHNMKIKSSTHEVQVPQCIIIVSHNAPLCNRNVHTCTFLLNMIHSAALCGLWNRSLEISVLLLSTPPHE